LPVKAVEESRDRVGAAIKNSGFKSPKGQNQKIVVSLAPADLKKEGPVFDLAVALAYLLAVGEVRFEPRNKIFLGELSLDGVLRPVRGTLPLVLEARDAGFEEVYLPKENADEASLVSGIKIVPAQNLKEVIGHLVDKKKIPYAKEKTLIEESVVSEIDFGDIKGQALAKRGLLIAASGGHNVAMYGPPGTGKTMLARAFSGLLPRLSFDEMLSVTAIHSVAGYLKENYIKHPPFRSPHHTSSYVSMVGGGTFPKPGEVTLAHKGVLFLDEFPEFERRVIDALREPLEERVINISRSRGSASFPAEFILIAALNPCPCGNYGSDKTCVCPMGTLIKYQRKISGPIADRLDIWLEVSKVDYSSLGDSTEVLETEKMREKVLKAREKQRERYKNDKNNATISSKKLLEIMNISSEAKNILEKSAEKMGLSARGFHKAIKVARTIADLEDSHKIKTEHILEALQYRIKQTLS
ncbi:MAG: YifB family Mg chelatase-like AAA ATPase, partial [Patescibacteria group bacterium]